MSAIPPLTGREGRKFGRRLAFAARAAGFSSIISLGDAAGVSRESMRKYRVGARMPTAPILLELARILGVTPGWLLGASARDEAHGVLRARELELEMAECERAGAEPSMNVEYAESESPHGGIRE